jgi:hypothetical protein
MADRKSPSTGVPETRAASTERPVGAGGNAETTTAGRTQYATGDQNNGSIIDKVKQSATAQLTQQKDRGADALGSVEQAVRATTQRLRDEKHDTIARYVDQAADQFAGWTRRLKEKNIDELATDVQRLARRQPAAFIGSAFALGLIAARFLKSSHPENEDSESESHRYSTGVRMSTASDRSPRGRGREAEVGIAAHEAAIPDVPGGRAGANGDVDDLAGAAPRRGRKPANSRMEKM